MARAGKPRETGTQAEGTDGKQEARPPACPICREGLSRSGLVLCQDCSTPHHRKCWRFNRGCATYGCQGRVFVTGPGAVAGELEFCRTGSAALPALVTLIAMFAIAAALLKNPWLIGRGAGKAILRMIQPLFWGGIAVSILGPLASRRKYLLDPEAERISRSLWFGPVRLRLEESWRDFSEVEGLDVRLAEIPGRFPLELRKGVELWMRDASGGSHLLDRVAWEDREMLLRSAAAAAEVLDTTLGLPRALDTEVALPAGLSRTLRALPSPRAGREAPAGLPGPV